MRPRLRIDFRRAATPTPTIPAPTRTPGPCRGDCNSDGTVKIDELLRGVAIALGEQSTGACPSSDTNSDGFVRIDELMAALASALYGCTR